MRKGRKRAAFVRDLNGGSEMTDEQRQKRNRRVALIAGLVLAAAALIYTAVQFRFYSSRWKADTDYRYRGRVMQLLTKPDSRLLGMDRDSVVDLLGEPYDGRYSSEVFRGGEPEDFLLYDCGYDFLYHNWLVVVLEGGRVTRVYIGSTS